MSLTREQVEVLLRPIAPQRVLEDNKGMSHVSQQDVRAHLTRIFGFGGWSDEVRDLTLVREAPGKDKNGKDRGWAVTYRALVRLTVRDPEGQVVASFDDVATGTSPNLPTLGDAHDFACKVAVSMALKRAATNLGDGFGLSLYNRGQIAPLVIDTLVKPGGEVGRDVSDDVPQQVDLGHDDAGSSSDSDELPEASLPEKGYPPYDPQRRYSSAPQSVLTPDEKGSLRAEIVRLCRDRFGMAHGGEDGRTPQADVERIAREFGAWAAATGHGPTSIPEASAALLTAYRDHLYERLEQQAAGAA